MEAGLGAEAAESGPTWMDVGPELYKDGKWAANKIKRAWKKRRNSNKNKRKRLNNSTWRFGDHPGTKHNQTAQTAFVSNAFRSSRTIYSGDLIDITKAVDHELNRRNYETVHIKGIKVTLSVVNRNTSPLYFNYAVIVPKFDQSTATVPTGDFFRSNANGRGLDFSNSLSSLEFHYQPINTDLYHVLTHKRMKLGPLEPTLYTDGSTTNYATFQKYIKVNRQIRYENNNPVNGRIIYVYWCDLLEADPSDTPTASAFTYNQYNVVYFSDPK